MSSSRGPPPPLPESLPLPASHARLLRAFTALDALICFLVKARLSCSLQAVLAIAHGAVSEDDVRALLAVAPAGLVTVRPTPTAAQCAVFDGAGRWRSGAGGPLARPLMHVAAPLPELPDIDLDEDDASKPVAAPAAAAAAGAGPGAVPAAAGTGPGSMPAAPAAAASSGSSGSPAGGALGQLIVTLQPPGVGKQAAGARRSAMLQALLRHVSAAHEAYRAAAARSTASASSPPPPPPPPVPSSQTSAKRKRPAPRSSSGGAAGGGAAGASASSSSWLPGFDVERHVPPIVPAPLVPVDAPLAGASPDAAAPAPLSSATATAAAATIAAAAAGAPPPSSCVSDIEALLRGTRWYAGQLAHVQTRAARSVAHGELPPHLRAAVPAAVWAALAAHGISRLFSHQAEAIAASLAGRDVVLATPTSSGKSVAFHVPAFTALLDDPDAVVLYVFPTKALAQDQLRAVREFLAAAPPVLAAGVRPATLDGDTPLAERQAAQAPGGPNLLLVNPDILHASVLPGHARAWRRLLGGLRLLVLDEGHVYRGMFGAHVALTLRRLLRLVALHGAPRPRLVLCTATIANPAGLLHRLVPPLSEDAWAALGGARAAAPAAAGAAAAAAAAADAAPPPAVVIGADRDGSGCGTRRFLVWNPPLLPRRAAGIAAGTASADVNVSDLDLEEELHSQQQRRLLAGDDGGAALPSAAWGVSGGAAVAGCCDDEQDEDAPLPLPPRAQSPSRKRQAAKRRRSPSDTLRAGERAVEPVADEDAHAGGSSAAAGAAPSAHTAAAAASAARRVSGAAARVWRVGAADAGPAAAAAAAAGDTPWRTDATGCVLVTPPAYFAVPLTQAAASAGGAAAAAQVASSLGPTPAPPAAASSHVREQGTAEVAEGGSLAAAAAAEAAALARLERMRRGVPANAVPGAYRRSAQSAPYALARAATVAAAGCESSSESGGVPPAAPTSTPPPPLPKWVQRYLRQHHPPGRRRHGGWRQRRRRRRRPV